MHFLINRTDNIGDVILTMPLAAQLKKYFPDCKISILARPYAAGVIHACLDIDTFISAEDLHALPRPEQIRYLQSLKIDVFIPSYTHKGLAYLMKAAGVPVRLGHVHRYYYFWTANKMLWLKRKRCGLHQAQMSMQFLKAFHLPWKFPRDTLHNLIRLQVTPSEKIKSLLNPKTFNLVLHPGSNGNAVEWPQDHFAKLIQILPPQVKIYLTGSAAEGDKFKALTIHPRVTPMFGQLSLDELTAFLAAVDGVVVGSTGPLHIAAGLGTCVLGLFPAQQDLNVERWGPIGKNASALEAPHCAISRAKNPQRCDCIKLITPEQVCDFMQQNWFTTQHEAT